MFSKERKRERERVKACFFTFIIIISHAFPENFIEIPRVVQIIWRFSPSVSDLRFKIFCWFFGHFLVAKKIMASSYNRWCEHFFYFQPTLNRLKWQQRNSNPQPLSSWTSTQPEPSNYSTIVKLVIHKGWNKSFDLHYCEKFSYSL